MWDSLPLELNAQVKIVRDGHIIKTEIWIIKIEEFITYVINIEMEISLSGFLEVKGKVTLGLEKPDVMPTQIHDWPINSLNDNQIPELEINIVELDPKGKITALKQKQINLRL